jgi:PII-like signaling protein
MKIETEGRLVTVYVNSTDQWHGQPLYAAVVQLCERKGIAGATVVRCTEGYGAAGQLHAARLLEWGENVPVRVEIVDRPERIEPLLADVRAMVGEGLVTVSDVHILRFLPDPHP